MKRINWAGAVALALLTLGIGVNPGAVHAATPRPQSEPLPTVTEEATPLPITATPWNANSRYVGRFDQGKDYVASPPRCAWSGSSVTVRFSGTGLNVILDESSDSDAYEIVLDDAPAGVLFPRSGSHRYAVYPLPPTGALPGPHTITLVKRTEAFVGNTQFDGFEVSSGGRFLSAPPSAKRRIEVIGDSISCGYGNEAPNEKEHFDAKTENAYLTYGAIAARRLNADFVCIAWSGRLMWPTNTMDEVYGRTLPTDPSSRWEFVRWTPDVVVINLGTNDFYAKTLPDDAGWIGGYRAFLARVRKNYPRALIYCATSPMLWGDKDTLERKDLNRIVDEEHQKGHANVRFLDFKTQNPADGLGADWHPNVKTHEIMADTLTTALESDLKWKSVTTSTKLH